MSDQLKQVVENSLRGRNAGPQIISMVETYIQRALIDLQRSNLLPPRKLEFVSKERKQEKRDDEGNLIYNFYYLPKDFRELDEFRPYKSGPYIWTSDKHDLYKKTNEPEASEVLNKPRRKFTIVNSNVTEDGPYQKILIAKPFPDDNETIELNYYINMVGESWEWIDPIYYEAIIHWIYKDIGLPTAKDVDEEVGRVVSQEKNLKGRNTDNNTFTTLNGGSYFGKRNRDVGFRRTYNRRGLR